jgi:large subunit ribosomal protein L6
MSRIGTQLIKLPAGVTLKGPEEDIVYIQGPKGTLTQYIDPAITITVENGMISLTRRTNQKTHKALHGLYRALLHNMVIGVSEGFKRTLEVVGVGSKASAQNNILELSLGYSHAIYFAIPPEIRVEAETPKGKNPLIHLEGIEKQLIGQVAAKIKSLRKVEPYKGKGIRFLGEQVRRKAGKTASK